MVRAAQPLDAPHSRAPEPSSPCINVCAMDEERGLCRGCHRTLDEIAHWAGYSRDEKIAVLGRLAQRKAAAHESR